MQVFDKDSSFDPRADPIVRVQARRLRARLVRYYREEGGADAVVIELPKGGYAPVFKVRDSTSVGRRSISATLAAQNTIAVLPFADHSQGHDLEYFCQGLRQETIHRLAKLEALRVLTLQPGEPSANEGRRADESRRHAVDRRRAQIRRPAADHHPSRRQRNRIVSVVGVDRRGR